jgi:hypothetical protein
VGLGARLIKLLRGAAEVGAPATVKRAVCPDNLFHFKQNVTL